MIRSILITLAIALAATAWGEDVHVAVKVAEASNSGAQIAPELQHMSRDFRKKGLAFSSYKLLAQQTLDIQRDVATSINVPGEQTITLTWTGETAGKFEFKVDVPGQPELNLRVHGGGCSFVEAGKASDGSMILMELKHQKNTASSGTVAPPSAAP